MPDFLIQTLGGPDQSTPLQMAARLGVAFVCGCLIALVYRGVRPREQVMETFPATLVLLSILCAMLPLVIGQNIAWAFGLVGALSIVRFRTVVEDTHDITFVIFAVLVGMAVGAGQLTVALIGICVVGGAAFLVRPRNEGNKWVSGHAKLMLRLSIGRDPETVFKADFDEFLSSVELTSGATTKQGDSIDLTYRVRLKPDAKPTSLINRLNLIDGVQSVDLRRGR